MQRIADQRRGRGHGRVATVDQEPQRGRKSDSHVISRAAGQYARLIAGIDGLLPGL